MIGLLFAPAYLYCLPSIDLRKEIPVAKKLRVIDWTAIAIFFGGTVCFTMGINFGGTLYAWDSGSEIALWVMAGVLLIAMILVTIFHPFVSVENKLYPSHFLRQPVLLNLQLQMFLVSGVMLVSSLFPPRYFG